MNDADIVGRIDELLAEEHRLEQAHVGERLSEDEQAHLQQLQVSLDQCWDLLRQRRARRAAGQDPEGAAERPGAVVEHYEQ